MNNNMSDIIMKRLAMVLTCLACALCCGCGERQAAEPEPVGSVYQIWLSDEWRPCYLHWLAEGSLLVGSVEPPGEDSRGFSYLEVMDLVEGQSAGATTGFITDNWFYDVRAVDDAEAGVVYLHNKFESAAGLQFGGLRYMSNGAYIPESDNPVAFVLGDQSLHVEKLWEDWEPTGWLLEIAPGELFRLVDLQGERFATLVDNEAIGVDYVDYDFSPDQRTYAQLGGDGRLVLADLDSGEVQDCWLEPPEGWVNYTALRFLPDNRSLAVTVLCEDRTVVRIWQVAEDLRAEPRLLAEIDGYDMGEDLNLLAAVDADRLLLNCDKTQVKLFNWRTGEVEKLYDAGEYLKLRWGCKYLAAPEDLHVLLDPERTRGYVQTAAYDPESGRLAVIKYFPKEDTSQLIVLDNWQ